MSCQRLQLTHPRQRCRYEKIRREKKESGENERRITYITKSPAGLEVMIELTSVKVDRIDNPDAEDSQIAFRRLYRVMTDLVNDLMDVSRVTRGLVSIE